MKARLLDITRIGAQVSSGVDKRAVCEEVFSWKPERLVIAHGECARKGATPIIAVSLSWMQEILE